MDAATPAEPVDLSVVVPMYDEEAVLPLFAARLRPVLDALVADGIARSYEVLPELAERGVRLHVDRLSAVLAASVGVTTTEATEEDWATEYLDSDLAVAVVDSLDAAIAHIRRYSSGHTEAIVTTDLRAADTFVAEVDSAVVAVNASTAFTDGAEFGLGAEIGISTQKLHARGPMGLAELTSTKWVVVGDGHIRP